MKIINTNFAQEDIKLLKSQFKVIYIAGIIITGVLFSLVYYLYKMLFIFNERWEGNIFQILVMPLVVVALIYVLYSAIQYQKDIKLGKKEVLMGVLTKKEEIWKLSNRNSNSSLNSKYDYFFYLDGEKIPVDNFGADGNYNKAEIGQIVAIERTIYAKVILKIEVLKTIK